MNMISELRQRVRQSGKAEITAAEYDMLQAEWIVRTGIDADELLRKDVKILRDAIEYSGVAKDCQELADVLAATEPK